MGWNSPLSEHLGVHVDEQVVVFGLLEIEEIGSFA
jgi:hypothetical protein